LALPTGLGEFGFDRIDEPVLLRANPNRKSTRLFLMPISTVGTIERRLGLGKLAALEAKPAAARYERQWPGELIHLDTKKFGPHRRDPLRDPASLQQDPHERAQGHRSRFFERALSWFAGRDVTVKPVMTDERFGLFQQGFPGGLKYKRTRP
jgi:hypothetical protein